MARIVDLDNLSKEQIEAGAKAMHASMYAHSVASALESINAVSLPLSAIQPAFSEAVSGSDRTASIVIFALIERFLLAAFQNNLVSSEKSMVNKIVGDNGILPTASSRLTMARALGWISANSYHDGNLVRRIRNEFAHNVEGASFLESPVSGYLTSFKIDVVRFAEPALKIVDLDQRIKDGLQEALASKGKLYFCLVCLGFVEEMFEELLVLPWCREHRVNPGSILRTKTTDGMLESLRNEFLQALMGYLRSLEK